MWIKRTTVSRGGRQYAYLQLMKSFYQDGRSRQVVVAPLGRADRIDRALAQELAESITDKPYIFLPAPMMELLPCKFYGETFLLSKGIEITSLRRFLEDLANFKGLSRGSVDALFLLVAYYSFQKHRSTMKDFLKEYYIRNENEVSYRSFVDALFLLRDTPLVHPGILTNYDHLKNSSHLKCYYLFDCRADPLIAAEGRLRLSIMTDGTGGLLYCKSYSREDPPTLYPGKDTMFISSHFPPGPLPFDWKACPCLCRIEQRQLSRLVGRRTVEQFLDLPCEHRYGDLFYSFSDVGDHRLICLSPGSGPVRQQPHDLLITNLREDIPELLRHYSYMDGVRDCFYEIFLPRDLSALSGELPGRELQNVLINIQFLRLFIEDQLSVRLSPLHLSAADAYALFRNNRIASLEYGNHHQLIHTEYSPIQTQILQMLAFNRPSP